MKKENKVEEMLEKRIAQSLAASPAVMEWLNNIQDNYNDGTDTEIRLQLFEMSRDLDLGLTFDSIDEGYQNWYPEGEGEKISISELLQILDAAGYKAPGREVTVQAQASSIDRDIKKYKQRLINKAKKSGLYENFGDKEIGLLKDRYSDELSSSSIDSSGPESSKSLEAFVDWCMNFDLEELKAEGKKKTAQEEEVDEAIKDWTEYWGTYVELTGVYECDFAKEFEDEMDESAREQQEDPEENRPNKSFSNGEAYGLFETQQGDLYHLTVTRIPYDLDMQEALTMAWKKVGPESADLNERDWKRYGSLKKKTAQESGKVEKIIADIKSGENEYFDYSHFDTSNMADYTLMSTTMEDLMSLYDINEQEAADLIQTLTHKHVRSSGKKNKKQGGKMDKKGQQTMKIKTIDVPTNVRKELGEEYVTDTEQEAEVNVLQDMGDDTVMVDYKGRQFPVKKEIPTIANLSILEVEKLCPKCASQMRAAGLKKISEKSFRRTFKFLDWSNADTFDATRRFAQGVDYFVSLTHSQGQAENTMLRVAKQESLKIVAAEIGKESIKEKERVVFIRKRGFAESSDPEAKEFYIIEGKREIPINTRLVFPGMEFSHPETDEVLIVKGLIGAKSSQLYKQKNRMDTPVMDRKRDRSKDRRNLQDGSGKGKGVPEGLRRNRNKKPCPFDKDPGKGEGGGRGKGLNRK